MKLKILSTAILFAIAVFGFMIKLPTVFHYHDKELHVLFFFFASMYLHIVFAEWKPIRSLYIFAFLFVFGVLIEVAQHLSNYMLHKRIHGRLDPEDIFSDFIGLFLFAVLWGMGSVVYNLNKH